MAVLNFIALALYFYWTIWWSDILVHTLAGLIGGFIAIWFFFDSGLFFKNHPTSLQTIVVGVICVLIAGIAWEIFEYVYISDIIEQSTENYTLDTINDFLADLIGAILAGIIGAKKIFRSDNQLET